MDINTSKETENKGQEEETPYPLVESIIDALGELEDSSEKTFEITYYKDNISSEQFDRIYKISRFILESIFPLQSETLIFKDFNETHKKGLQILRAHYSKSIEMR